MVRSVPVSRLSIWKAETQPGKDHMSTVKTPDAQPEAVSATGHLSDERLERFATRAEGYDRENRFFEEDFEELRESGYLVLPVPVELGGGGASLADVCAEQRRLGYHAAATALGVNMHLYWVGIAADLWRAGDTSLQWLLEEAAAGKVFAAGHAESGNDVPVLYATTTAEAVDGGYRFTGRKSFGSLTPVWDYLGIHGMDLSRRDDPRVVHGFLAREDGGFRVKSTWDDVLGMRATRSDDTILEGAFVPEPRIARVVPPGFKGIDPFVLGIFAWALMGFANIYYGLGRRILDVTVERLKKKSSIALSRPSMAHHAGSQDAVAEMVIELEGIEPHLDRVAADWAAGAPYGAAWGPKIVTAKYRAVSAVARVADLALDVMGGFGIFPASGLERLIRDARLGPIHPTNRFLTREIVGKATLGLDLDEQPRWG
jgi:alkylation response protein AidB-like acyl-CoA dehydrogenase